MSSYTLFLCKMSRILKRIPFSPYALYPPNPNNTLHMYIRTFSNQAYTTDYTTHLINPNALFYERSPDYLLVSQPRVIRPKKALNLSPLHVQLFPNESRLTYDKDHFDKPTGLETDITIIFYREDELFNRHKGAIINQ